MNLIFSIMGLIGGLLCCTGDVLFDLKGKGNEKLGTSKNIDSNWSKMAEWRFKLSIICAMFGVILVGFGFYAIGDMIRENDIILSNWILITGFIGCTGGLFVHSLLCIQERKMNKKVLTLLVVVILAVIVGGIVFALNRNKTTDTRENIEGNLIENTNNSEEINNTENKNQTTLNESINNTKTGKILVLYFSQSGNTEAVANIIHNEVGGDIVKLETVQTYPSDYNELVDYAQKEQKQNARPELKTKIDNIEQYDTIFLGYPNWWADMPMPLYTFLDEYDLSGKTIAPFITHGGSGLSGTPDKIKKEEPNATVTEGLAVSGSNAKNSGSTVKN